MFIKIKFTSRILRLLKKGLHVKLFFLINLADDHNSVHFSSLKREATIYNDVIMENFDEKYRNLTLKTQGWLYCSLYKNFSQLICLALLTFTFVAFSLKYLLEIIPLQKSSFVINLKSPNFLSKAL